MKSLNKLLIYLIVLFVFTNVYLSCTEKTQNKTLQERLEMIEQERLKMIESKSSRGDTIENEWMTPPEVRRHPDAFTREELGKGAEFDDIVNH